MTRKIQPNVACPCNSGKKYKKCHMLLDENHFHTGQEEESSENVQKCEKILSETFVPFNFIDITMKLTDETSYKKFQYANWDINLVMIAQRTAANDELFVNRLGNDAVHDIILMRKGCYCCVHSGNIEDNIQSIDELLKLNCLQS